MAWAILRCTLLLPFCSIDATSYANFEMVKNTTNLYGPIKKLLQDKRNLVLQKLPCLLRTYF